MTEVLSAETAPRLNHVDALPVGARLAEFEILSLLGVGGFGMVYKAFDHSLHRAVAIKEYMPTALAGRAQGQSLWVRSSSNQQSFQAGLASFVSEARLLAQFDHPSLVKVFRFWEANNTAYMVMPLYSGMTFKQARAQMRTPPPEAWMRKLLWSVLGALRVLHDADMLHRDISPDNIFLQDFGPPVLLDLGAARHAISDQDRQLTAVLKVNYAPIEQYSEGDIELRQGPWSDLYSLAAVVHGCLCNDTPLPATLRSIRDRMVPFARVTKTVQRQFGVEYSAPFATAISKALALQPEDRPQSIDEFLHLMEMTAPPGGMDHFDFRAELGDIWVEPADQPGPGQIVPTVDITSASKQLAEIQAHLHAAAPPPANEKSKDVDDTVLMADVQDTVMMAESADTVFLDDLDSRQLDDLTQGDDPHRHATTRRVQAQEAFEAPQLPPSQRHKVRRSSSVGWIIGLAAVAMLLGAIWWWAHSRTKPRPPVDDIITELAQPAPPASAALPAEAGASEAAMTASGAAEAMVAASEPAPAEPQASVAAVPTPPPAPRPAQRPTPRRQVAEPAAPAVVAAPVPPPEPPPPPKMEKPPVVARLPNPQDACADANFLAKPLCVHQQCQKSAFANHPVCLENKRRYEADEQRRRQYN